MRYIGAALVLLVPLALAPGWFFYYDITPKACLLYVGAAVLGVGAWLLADSFQTFRASRVGRWYIVLLAAMALMSVFSATCSPQPALAWMGSNWRRGGAISELAILTAAFVISLVANRSTEWRFTILRALCVAG